jgi:hypothetical protein
MDYFTTYIYLIFVIKIIFLVLSVTYLYLKAKKKDNTDFYKKIVFWKERTELVFIVLMSILLITLFNPRTTSPTVMINGNSKFLLFLFGIVLLITADWSKIITQAPWFLDLQKIIGKN